VYLPQPIKKYTQQRSRQLQTYSVQLKSRALNIINARLANEKADFAFRKVPQESVKQSNVEGVGPIGVPISEQNWFKLRDVAHQSPYTEEQRTA
jgi:hypothetical protein